MFKKYPLLVFILIYLFIWVGLTLLIHSQTSISPDTAENIMWGMNLSFMYDKHPGLGPFFLKILMTLFPPLLANLIASATCIITSWLFIYKLAKIYFEKKEAIFITLLSAMNFFYMGEFFLQYNQNIILLPFWCASAYYFVKSLKSNNTLDWVLLGAMSALGVYAKFQIGLLLICMFLYLVLNFDRKYIKNFLWSFAIFLVMLLPGLVSLYNIDFSPIVWALDRSNDSHTSILINLGKAILNFIFQLLNLAFAFVVILYMKRKKMVNHNNKPIAILFFIGLLPYIIFSILEVLKGRLPVEWLVVTTSLIVIALYSLFRIKFLNINFKN